MVESPSATTVLLSLPPEVLEKIGFYCAMHAPGSASNGLSGGRAPSTGDEDYDRAAPPAYATPPANLRNFVMTCHTVHDALNARTNTRLYAQVFRTKFDVAAIERRFGRQAVSSASLTKELRRRCVCLKRIRKAVDDGHLRGGDDDDDKDTQAVVQENLWLAYLMMTENDGFNIRQLRWAHIEAYLKMHRNEELLSAALQRGYPPDAPQHALAMHLDYMLTDPTRIVSEARDESEANLFVLRPFVFAAHRFDAYYAPWTMRTLPIGGVVGAAPPTIPVSPFVADLRPKESGMAIQHCGRSLIVRAPNVVHAACCSFFVKVERDPSVSAPRSFLARLMSQGTDGRSDSDSDLDSDDAGEESGPRQARSRASRSHNPLDMRSHHHDRDIARLLACTSPFQSAGLSALTHAGEMQGSWEGRFTFFDFDCYRDMLGGKVRSLYEGPFGEQAQVWKLREHVVKVTGTEQEGGTGSTLNAGYNDGEEPSQRTALTQEEVQALQRRTTGGADQAPELANDRTERYEILLSGEGHSAWGRFVLRGRVRSWDGMVTMTKEYRPDGRGRWLYRGYVVAGNKMVGRWRDTFTPDNLNGYEG